MKPYQVLLRLHESVYRRTRGWLGHRLIGMPTLLLTTRGRRTGRERTRALVYAASGTDLAVVASNGGQDAPPAWLLNLTADPRVTVRLGRHRYAATARVVPPGDDRYDALLARCDAVNRGRYSQHRQMTSRPIPVVVLERMA